MLVKLIFINSKKRYGILRIKADLEVDYGVIVSRKLIAKIMKYYKIKVKMKSKNKKKVCSYNWFRS